MADNKFFAELTDIRGVPAANKSGKVSIRIPATGRIFNLKQTIAKGAALATLQEIRDAIPEIRFILGTEVVQRCSAADYYAILMANNYPIEAGMLPRYWAEPWRATVGDEEVLAPDLRRYSDVSMEMDVVNGATALDFNCNWEFDDRSKTQRGADGVVRQVMGMIGITRQSEDLGGGTPTFKLDPVNGPLQRLHIITPDTTVLSRVRVLQGETAIYDIRQTALRPDLKQQLKDMGMVIPATYTVNGDDFNSWPVVFDNNQQLRNAIKDTAGLRIELTLSAPATVNILREVQIER